MAKLTKAQKKLLEVLATDKGTLVSWPDYGVVFDLQCLGFIEEYSDPLWPAFAAMRITEAGRAALTRDTQP